MVGSKEYASGGNTPTTRSLLEVGEADGKNSDVNLLFTQRGVVEFQHHPVFIDDWANPS